jgi:Lysozyme like domain
MWLRSILAIVGICIWCVMTSPTSTFSGTLNYSQLESLWISAGGAPNKAPIAAAVAIAESGGRQIRSPANTNGSVDVGYWQINTVHGSQATLDPMGNARAAVGISQNGTNWRPWCTAWSTGKCRGTYDPTGSSPVGRAYAARGNAAPAPGTVAVPGGGGTAAPAALSTNPLTIDFWTHTIDVVGNWMFYGALILAGGVVVFLGTFQLIRDTAAGRAVVGGVSRAVRLAT